MPTQHTIDALRNQLQRWSAKHHKPSSNDIISTGCAEFDSLLPKGGFVPGQLVEWLGARPGSGAQALSWIIAMRSVSATHPVATTVAQTIVVVDREGDFYPSAAIAWGIKSEQIMIVRPKHMGDTLWVIDQALRCSAVAAVWTALEQIDSSHFRRMQLAAEEGSTLGLLVRPATVRGQPSWSDLQLLVEPRPLAAACADAGDQPAVQSREATHAAGAYLRAWQLQVLRCRGGTAGESLVLQMEETTGQLQTLTNHHETSALHLAAQLARPANRRRSARA